jgi:hypothetical protein
VRSSVDLTSVLAIDQLSMSKGGTTRRDLSSTLHLSSNWSGSCLAEMLRSRRWQDSERCFNFS